MGDLLLYKGSKLWYDLPANIKGLNNKVEFKKSMFADDCMLYISGNTWPTVRNKLQCDLDKFVQWIDINALRLNTIKTKAMIFGNRNKLLKIKDPVPLQIYGKNLGFVTKYNYLGVILDSEMTLEPFFKTILKRINSKIYNLRKIRKYLSFEIAVQIYKQTILPYFDYGGFLIIALSKDKKHELQVMQNDVLRICNNSKLADRISIELLHKKANLLSLEQRREKQVLMLMYLYSQHDNVRKICARETRSTNKFIFKTDTKVGTKYENSPFYKGTKLWNKLTRDVQFAENRWIFKGHLSKMYKKYENV